MAKQGKDLTLQDEVMMDNIIAPLGKLTMCGSHDFVR